MKEIYGNFIEKIQRTPTVFSFRFQLEEKIDFIPGQFMEVIFDKEDKNLRHFLSFSCSPLRDYIEFTKRISESKFCQRLKELKPEDKILFKLPLGSCVLKESYKKISFIIGGIGITPVISILEYIADKNLDIDVFLIYCSRSEEEIAFKEELDSWREKINLNIFYMVTYTEPRDKEIKKGVIDMKLLSQYKREFRERINFVFGPPKMVEVIVALLQQLGIEENKIELEKFIGY
jgi:ferredoxin-NADP reductase